MELYCFSCQKVNSYRDSVGFRDECNHCRADLHVCKNCEFYDPKAYNECRETSADVVREKDRANFCDFFSARKGASALDDQKAKLKAAAESLFKK
ncbi:MAG: hypothetical protein H7328_01285 [Bdellovibrio sp.]|nr:hypothetical protein [Bdellovibrio sp.]